MVIVRLKGETGNQMCQYTIGRIIAERKGYCLRLDSSDDGWKNSIFEYFPNTKELEGKQVNTNHLMIGPNLNHIDLEQAFNHDGLIFLHGFWQKHYLYYPYREQIKKWFEYDESKYEKPGNDDVVVHCRLGETEDRLKENIEEGRIAPIKVFKDIINTLDYNKCIVLTDAPNCYLLDDLRTIKNVTIKSGSKMSDFTYMKCAKRLILSQSSFSWWASFLGEQEKVYAPLTLDNPVHFWQAKPTLHQNDLIPTNEKYIKFYI
jgi:hypothetical protein